MEFVTKRAYQVQYHFLPILDGFVSGYQSSILFPPAFPISHFESVQKFYTDIPSLGMSFNLRGMAKIFIPCLVLRELVIDELK